MAFFKSITTSNDLNETEKKFGLNTNISIKSNGNNLLIMGRKTYESIPQKFRPLPDRRNIVLTHNTEYKEKNIEVINDIDHIINNSENDVYKFVTGGSSLYNNFMNFNICTRIYLTEVLGDFGCNVFINKIPQEFIEISCSDWHIENNIKFRFKILEREQK